MKTRPQSAFTIVELLVIIVVIGILLSLSVFSYGDWRTRTAKNEVQSNLIQLRGAMENERNFSTTGYPTSIPSSYITSGTVSIVLSGGGAAYCAVGTSTVRSTVVYYISLPNTPNPTTTKPAGCP